MVGEARASSDAIACAATLLLAALVAIAIALPSAAQAHGIKNCGGLVSQGAGIFSVKAQVVTCRVARRVARAAQQDWKAGGFTSGGWRCREVDSGWEYSKTRCTRKRSTVWYESGS